MQLFRIIERNVSSSLILNVFDDIAGLEACLLGIRTLNHRYYVKIERNLGEFGPDPNFVRGSI
jgi:hypothetical protein